MLSLLRWISTENNINSNTSISMVNKLNNPSLAHSYKNIFAVKTPATSAELIVTKLLTDKRDIPVIPWPEVQPPAIRAPRTIKRPPSTDCQTGAEGGTGASDITTAGNTRLSAHAPAAMPPANMIDLYLGRSDSEVHSGRQRRSPASSSAVDTPTAVWWCCCVLCWVWLLFCLFF